eukprot:COSAG04_NODE_2255_length_4440_cov_25.402952_5_plen_59_part_00
MPARATISSEPPALYMSHSSITVHESLQAQMSLEMSEYSDAGVTHESAVMYSEPGYRY